MVGAGSCWLRVKGLLVGCVEFQWDLLGWGQLVFFSLGILEALALLRVLFMVQTSFYKGIRLWAVWAGNNMYETTSLSVKFCHSWS